MRIPLSWLRELCPVRLSPADLAEAMTMRGLPVERILHPWERLDGVRVARVLEVTDHPQADRLVRTVVDDGGSQHQVVVGVRNMGPGDLVPYAPPGASVPGLEGTLEQREIRGVTSEGMLCSAKELAISGDHHGILVLPSSDGLEPGADLKDALGLDEAVIDIEVLANRADLLSVAGVAREVAAMTGQDLRPPDTTVVESIERAAGAVSVEVREPDRCSRYVARVIREVVHRPSPLHAQVRLAAAGMRPLSAVVDATNYVMLELGQPLHPFDLATLAGPGIVVRVAEEGERLRTLDGVDRALTAEDLLIADPERAVGIAGLMGGADTEVGPDTTDVLLEAAHFRPTAIFRTSRRLGVRTEASIRFERGVDPEGVEPAAARAAALIASWAGGRVLSGAADAGEVPERRTVAIRPERASAILGVPVTAVEVREALGRLRIPAAEDDGSIVAEIPANRVDLEREVDLIEEVGRVTGYDRVPSTLPEAGQAGGLDRSQRIRRRIRDLLAGAGLFENLSFSFSPAGDAELAGGVALVPIANPISEEDAKLRATLVPGLLRAARRNVSHRRTSVRLFEVGAVFSAADPTPVEEERVAALLTGPATEGWPAKGRDQDFLDVKGLVEHLFEALGVEAWTLGEPAGFPWHSGRSAEVRVGDRVAGTVGELHSRVGRAFDLPSRVAALELGIPALVAAARSEVRYREVSRYPPARRDVAFVVDRDVPAGAIHAALVDAGAPLLDRAVLFDVFEGPSLPEGKISLAFALDLRASDRTLTDQEADQVVRAIADRLGRDFGADLRAS